MFCLIYQIFINSNFYFLFVRLTVLDIIPLYYNIVSSPSPSYSTSSLSSNISDNKQQNTSLIKTEVKTNYGDFIDYQPDEKQQKEMPSLRNQRVSRTKLHRVTNNFLSTTNLHTANQHHHQQQPINFINSPNHSPMRPINNNNINNIERQLKKDNTNESNNNDGREFKKINKSKNKDQNYNENILYNNNNFTGEQETLV
jgi:hypothetical protein